jgi:uncharacterized protein YcfJ
MVIVRSTCAGLVACLLLCGAASAQMVPSVLVTPGPNKPIEVFHQDQDECRDYAGHVVTGDADTSGDVVGGAVVGAALGAILGSGDGRQGAAFGAAAGGVAGAAIGASVADRDQAKRQRAYDDAYERCMYAHDNVLPGQQYDDAPPPPPPGRRGD